MRSLYACLSVKSLFRRTSHSVVKNPPEMQEIQHELHFQSLGQEDPLEKEMATYFSILAWEIPQTEEPVRLQTTGSQRVGHDLAIKQQQSLVEMQNVFSEKYMKNSHEAHWYLFKISSPQNEHLKKTMLNVYQCHYIDSTTGNNTGTPWRYCEFGSRQPQWSKYCNKASCTDFFGIPVSIKFMLTLSSES